MIVIDEERASDSPFVERIWRSHSAGVTPFLSIAVNHCEFVVSRLQGKVTMMLRGPETKATPIGNAPAEGEWVGILLKLGTFLPHLPTSRLVDDLPASDALLMGRVTYQIHAAVWPSMTDEEGFADLMNSLPKYVVSSTLATVEWNNSRLISGNIPEEVEKLKRETQRTILIDGGSGLVNLLMRHDLIDEYRLLVHPVVVGKGKRLFQEGGQMEQLKLVEAKPFSTAVIALTYQSSNAE